jgi:hypothetical protein
MAAPQQIEIQVPEEASSNAEARARLAENIISFIIERTRGGTGVRRRGKGFENYDLSSKPYTKEYADFKGTSVSDVDLTLSEEMLDAIQYFPSKSSAGLIVIGYKAGTKVNAKAEGNQIGSYGRSPNPKKARPFLGITRADLLGLL